ncbi:MAG TPA: hypothetical protein VFS05_06945 [Gemmatimonadaceae bacterium]|nr:hypothetical protein [Gemmatimonadaceae bacterium]
MISRRPQPEGQRELLGVKLALALVGLATFGYGVLVDSVSVRWLGITFLGAAFLVRFLRRRNPPPPTE